MTLHTRKGYDFADRLAAGRHRKAAGAVLPDRRRGHRLRREPPGGVRPAPTALARRGRDPCAFDLIELEEQDLRRVPIEERKAALAKLLRRSTYGIAFNEHCSGDGAIVYRHAWRLAPRVLYRSGWGHPIEVAARRLWIKVKNPAAPAVTREAEEEWNQMRTLLRGARMGKFPMDQRIESFLTDVLALAGEDPEAIREGVRVALADCEEIFRAQEMQKRM